MAEHNLPEEVLLELIKYAQGLKDGLEKIYTHSEPDGEQRVSAFEKAFKGSDND